MAIENNSLVLFGSGTKSGYAALVSAGSVESNKMYFVKDSESGSAEIYLDGNRYGFGKVSTKFVDSTGLEISDVEGKVVTGVSLDGDTLVIKFGTGVNASVTSEVLNQLKAAGGNVIKVTDKTGGVTGVDIDLAIDNSGNVVLEKTSSGLKASVTIPEDKVLGVKSGDKVLALGADKLLSTTLNLTYETVEDKKYIILKGIGGAEIAKIDAADFIKDGMVSNVTYNPDTKVATITFNTDAGKEAINVDLSTLVDTYTAGAGLKVENNEFAIDNAVTSTADEVDSTKNLDFGGSVEIGTAKYNAQGLVVGQKKTTINLPVLPTTNTVDKSSDSSHIPTAKAVETRVSAAESAASSALSTARGEITTEIATAKSEAIEAAKPVWQTF